MMNERIKELAQEVGISVEYLTNTKQIVLIEKFAELIVRECVSVMDITDVTDFRGIELALKIKEHFGVK